MPQTDIYNLWFADPGTPTSKYPEKDRERFEAIDIQLAQAYMVIGNGIMDGWTILSNVADGPRIYISDGYGVVYYKYAETTENSYIDLIVPEGANLVDDGVQYYVYGYENETTHFDKSITFDAFTTPQSDESYIYLGSIVLKTNTSGYYLSSIDYTNRDDISIYSSLSELINSHVHNGIPPKINLRTMTSGQLPGGAIEASLNANQITEGILDPDRLPTISHNDLSDNGVLNHDNIDSYLTSIYDGTAENLGDVAMANQLRSILALKAIYIDFDEYLLNSFFYIPGVTSDDYVDEIGTTAIIDDANHQIVGLIASPSTSDFVTWRGENEFQAAIDDYDLSISDYQDVYEYSNDTFTRSKNVYVNDDGNIELKKPLNFISVYSKTLAENNEWDTYIETSATAVSSGGTIPVSVDIDYYKFYRFWNNNNPISKNLSEVNKLQFGISLVDPSILEHGEIYFFLIGADHDTNDSKSISYTAKKNGTVYSLSFSAPVKILDAEEQTSLEDDNIKTINVDLLQFPDRSSVQGFGFYFSTSGSWNLLDKYEFSLHQIAYVDMEDDVETYLKSADSYSIPDEGTIVMYCYNNLYHSSSGYITFRFIQTLNTQFDYVYWGQEIPSVPVDVTVPRVTVKTRSATNKVYLPETSYDIVSPIDHEIQSATNKAIDIRVDLVASSDNRYSPEIEYVTLYYTISSSSNSKSFATYEQFIDAYNMVNISTYQNPDRLEMTYADLVNSFFFIEGNAMKAIDEDQNIVSRLSIDGSTLYLAPRQVFAKAGAGFRKPRYLQIIDEGYIITDMQNDRIIEIDLDGDLVRAIQGNIYLAEEARDFIALTSIYNQRLGKFYIAFSQNINSSFDRTKFTIATSDGTNSTQLLTDTDALFYTVPDTDGSSAVLVIELKTAKKQQIDNWDTDKKILIAQGGVTGLSGSTSSSSEITPGIAEITANGDEIITPSGATTLSIRTMDDNQSVEEIIYQNRDGTLTLTDSSTTTTSGDADETNTYDYNSDGDIETSILADINGNTDVVEVDVVDADVIFANIRYPLTAQKDGENNYIIAQDHDVSIININKNEVTLWSIGQNIVDFDYSKGGNAQYLSDETVICASPSQKRVLQIVPITNAILYNYTAKFTPVYAERLDSGNTIVVIRDESYNSLNSRVYELDSSNNIVREFGLGRLKNPNHVYVMTNTNWIISC